MTRMFFILFFFRYLKQLIAHWCLGKDASLERFLTERDVSLLVCNKALYLPVIKYA